MLFTIALQISFLLSMMRLLSQSGALKRAIALLIWHIWCQNKVFRIPDSIIVKLGRIAILLYFL